MSILTHKPKKPYTDRVLDRIWEEESSDGSNPYFHAVGVVGERAVSYIPSRELSLERNVLKAVVEDVRGLVKALRKRTLSGTYIPLANFAYHMIHRRTDIPEQAGDTLERFKSEVKEAQELIEGGVKIDNYGPMLSQIPPKMRKWDKEWRKPHDQQDENMILPSYSLPLALFAIWTCTDKDTVVARRSKRRWNRLYSNVAETLGDIHRDLGSRNFTMSMETLQKLVLL